jgi:nitrite reductase (NADH) large subunit
LTIWHKHCNTPLKPIRKRWAALSVNDDRLAAQVVGNIGGSGMAVWFQHRKRTGKDAWNRKVSGVFFCFFSP